MTAQSPRLGFLSRRFHVQGSSGNISDVHGEAGASELARTNSLSSAFSFQSRDFFVELAGDCREFFADRVRLKVIRELPTMIGHVGQLADAKFD
jgi:hypothetical protein